MSFWVFAYGSLMADGWEQLHACKFRSAAVLQGHARSFDKASTESRGTKQHPAPTLRLVASKADCHGVAFEFDDEKRDAVLADLLKREGKTFPLREKAILLKDGRNVTALVPMYEGKQIITGKSLRELAEMAIIAKGIRGGGVDYVRDIARHLNSVGIEDPVISDFLNEIENCLKGNEGRPSKSAMRPL
ncbi:gamma-glutamylcyclotransferase [Rhodoplanes sp. Z2-YC6860]|uniref:gamma-glutamylcyclotransferase n=1 Tax=Rhodoplanes sp. Z2-YC6860 TaxID=674703 RepID=UPI00078E21B7|nr:gamma-glutamylcyclotransferase [Rhodoplanes sp. Z2-YC6860]AMN40483.1 cation transport protein [Rhodoplanes sp. Z2-YC6860]